MGPVLVLGATGMLGRALVAQGTREGIDVIGGSRSGSDLMLDVTDIDALGRQISDVRPSAVINTVAIVSIETCERDPGRAYRVNARPAAALARLSRELGFYNIHISTDHYFVDGGRSAHREDEEVVLINEYARTKYAADCFALNAEDSLVIRTNIVGSRHSPDRPTFGDWIVASIRNRSPITLFSDAFHSPIHTADLSSVLFGVMRQRAKGILNLAGSEVVSKGEFIQKVAVAMGVTLDWAVPGSVSDLGIPRAANTGLDVSRARNILGAELPDAERAAAQLAARCQR